MVIDNAKAARAWCAEQAICAGPWGFDIETVGINPKTQPAAGDNGRMVCFTIATPVRIAGDDLEASAAFFWADPDILAVMGAWWKSAPVVGHNLYGFDAHVCRRAGYPLQNIRMDTLRAHRLIDTGPDTSHGLKALMESWLGIKPVGKLGELFTRRKCLESVPTSELRTTWRKVDTEPRVPTVVGGAHSRFGELTELVPLDLIRTEYIHLLPSLVEYALLDAVATLKLWHKFERRMAGTAWRRDFV